MVHVGTFTFREGGAGQLIRRHLPQGRAEHILHHQDFQAVESGGRVGIDPGGLVAAADPHAAHFAGRNFGEQILVRGHAAHEMGDHFFDAAAIGAFLGANRKTIVESLVLADDRHRPQRHQGLGVDRAGVLGQQVSLFDRQVRREENAQPRGLAQLCVDFGQGVGPFDILITALLATANFRSALAAVDVVIAVTPFVAHPPLVDVGILRGLRR